MKPTTYRLGSSPLAYAPGFVAWGIEGYAFEDDRETLLNIFRAWPGVPDDALHALLMGEVPFEIDGETVVFTYPKED